MQHILQSFRTFYGDSPQKIHQFFCPGRVCLIGEHQDYNNGHVMPAAIKLGITALVRRREDDVIKVRTLQGFGECVIDLWAENFEKRSESWMNFPVGVVQLLKNERIAISGVEILLESSLPMSSGLSSSAAIEVLLLYIFLHLGQYPLASDKIQIAQWGKKIENEFIGVACGIMDQFAVAMGEKNKAIVLNCDTMEHHFVPTDFGEYEILILNTNKPRQLTESDFNQRQQECVEALASIQKNNPKVRYLAGACLGDVAKIEDLTLRKRAIHVVTENQRVLQSIEAFKSGDLVAFGQILRASHHSLKNDFEVSGYELDILAAAANSMEGCLGARMTGAGFGGCAIALVHRDKTTVFTEKITKIYNRDTDFELEVYRSGAEDGVRYVGII